MLNLTLISSDQDTCTFIQELVQDDPCIRLSITASFEDIAETPDVYIWDFVPELAIPADLNGTDPKRHLFLVRRKDLQYLRANVDQPGVGILLKPVARPVLQAFLGHAAMPETVCDSANGGRDELLQSLIQSNLKLQEYDQDRTNFLARAVHDFRAPLTALSGYCGLLLGEHLGPVAQEQKDVLLRMDRSIKRLSRIASAMFQLSVGRVIQTKLNLQPGDLRECMEQALHEALPLTDQKEIEVVFDWVTPPSSLHFECSQMEQVLTNLLENACKFTPRRGVIEVKGYPCPADVKTDTSGPLVTRASHQFNAFRIDIRDSGPAIPDSYLEEIFEEYTTYSGGRDRAGGGLGLAICRSIMALHQGCIWAENSAEGPVFSLLLPMSSTEQQIEPRLEQNLERAALAVEV